MRRSLPLLLCLAALWLLCPFLAVSQDSPKVEERTVILSGSVRNSFTGLGEGGAAVTVYREDGTVLVQHCLLITFGNRDRKGNEFRVTVPKG